VVSGVFSIPLEACSSPSLEASPCGTPRGAALREFIGDDENRLVEFAVQALLAGDRRYNPVVFGGPTGTGKSLLAHGLAERWRQERPDELVVVTCGADFHRSHAYALDTDSIVDFRHRMTLARLFVLDDLQQLNEKPAAQEEFARLLDVFVSGGTAVLVTTSEPWGAHEGLAAGLCSRLAGGLSVPLQPPGVSARRVLLRRIAETLAVSLSDAAIELLATGPVDVGPHRMTVPQLNHAVLQLAHAAQVASSPIEVDDVRTYLQVQARERQPTFRSIAAKTAVYFSVKTSQLRGPSQCSQVVRARGVAMLLARKLTGKSFEVIGQFFGQRDHTTVLHACRKIERLQEQDPAIAQAMDELIMQLTEPPST